MEKYKLLGNKENGFQIFETEGQAIVIQGFEEVRFIVHPQNDGWAVSEPTTGLRIAPGATRLLAIELATSVLDSYSKEYVHGALERANTTLRDCGMYPLNPQN